jgi:Uncharacterized alpha/beta hydrolase domain (DUF2235)
MSRAPDVKVGVANHGPAGRGPSVGKNILIFSDGTGQAGGYMPDEARSNVYKLFRATRVSPDTAIDPKLQIAFYDGGLGSRAGGEGFRIKSWRRLYDLAGKATGLGITQNIIDCYAAIISVWRPGDRIFLFGFSRGAYTVRCVAGVLKHCGVPTAIRGRSGRALLLPRDAASVRRIATEAVKHVYQYGSSIKGDPYRAEREQRAIAFRWRYFAGDERVSNTAPYFIGAWDTIATLGAGSRVLATLAGAYVGLSLGVAHLLGLLSEVLLWPAFVGLGFALPALIYLIGCWRYGGLMSLARYRMAFYDTRLNYAVRYARHALSIDENRKKFDCIPWHDHDHLQQCVSGTENVPRLKQLWFAGSHSDIGGSYPENESRLSDVALAWMVDEATSLPHPLLVDYNLLNVYPDSLGVQHDERQAFLAACPGWLAWFAKKLVGTHNLGWREGLRHVPPQAPLHPSVYERLALPAVLVHGHMVPYRPRALRHHGEAGKYFNAQQSGRGRGKSERRVVSLASRRMTLGRSQGARRAR